jgi:hypothetical protein
LETRPGFTLLNISVASDVHHNSEEINIMSRILNVVLLSATLLTPLTFAPSRVLADERKAARYQDKQHNDEHEWNSHEDKAYRMWAKENHRKYRTFSKLRDEDQRAYWNWRHEHSDAQLKIDIR